MFGRFFAVPPGASCQQLWLRSRSGQYDRSVLERVRMEALVEVFSARLSCGCSRSRSLLVTLMWMLRALGKFLETATAEAPWISPTWTSSLSPFNIIKRVLGAEAWTGFPHENGLKNHAWTGNWTAWTRLGQGLDGKSRCLDRLFSVPAHLATSCSWTRAGP